MKNLGLGSLAPFSHGGGLDRFIRCCREGPVHGIRRETATDKKTFHPANIFRRRHLMPLLETCQDQTSCDEALVLDRKYLFNGFFRDGGSYAFLDELPAKAPCTERPRFHSLTAPLPRKTEIVHIAQFGQVVQGDPDRFLGMAALLEPGADIFSGARPPGEKSIGIRFGGFNGVGRPASRGRGFGRGGLSVSLVRVCGSHDPWLPVLTHRDLRRPGRLP